MEQENIYRLPLLNVRAKYELHFGEFGSLRDEREMRLHILIITHPTPSGSLSLSLIIFSPSL